jgi:Transmembrane domain of unknown function (DUF3566)
VASRAGGDDLAPDGDLDSGLDGTEVTQPGEPAATGPSRTAEDSSAADGKPPDASAGDRSGSAAEGKPALPGDAATTEKVSPLPADTIGTFTRPVSVPASPDGDDPATGHPERRSRADRPPAPPIGKASFRTEPTAPAAGPKAAGPKAADPAPAAPPRTEPRPAATSAGAFAWQEREAEQAAAASAARTFLRAGANPRSSTPRSPAAAGGRETTAALPRGAPPKVARRSARQAHLTVARIEPWSVMKFSFVVSLVAFVILFVAVSLLYGALAGLGVFQSLQHVVTNVTSSQDSAGVNASNWFSASRVLGYTALLGSLNIVLITAMATIGAVIYNLSSRMVGGVEVTLRETE